MASFLIVLALCCNCFAAEPMEASFCSVWPLAAGNAWLTLNPRFEVVSQNTYNGYTAWRMQFTLHGIAGDTTVSAYWTFANGWLYETANEADLAMLPEIADGMYRVFPAVFRDGETFTMEGFIGRGAPINLTPVVTNAGVSECRRDTSPYSYLGARHGSRQLRFAFCTCHDCRNLLRPV